MKKVLYTLFAAAAVLCLFSCNKGDDTKGVSFNLQLTDANDGQPLKMKGCAIILYDANLTAFTYTSDDLGQAKASLPDGLYTWIASGQVSKADSVIKYNGASTAPFEVKAGMETVDLPMNKVVSISPIIIKEAYIGGYTDSKGKSVIMKDSYIILYNNSAADADASDIVFTCAAPYNGEANNAYYNEGGKLLYEGENWIPALGAIWWFKSPVTIPAYSQIVVACYGAIDHTQTDPESVNLSNAEYYWMSNVDIATQYKSANYTRSDNIPETHHLTCSPFTPGTAWALSTLSPALYIGKMKAAEAERVSKDSENYDHTLGTSAAFNVVKFPKSDVVDAIEIFNEAKVESSKARFPAAVNTGYTVLTNKKGHSTYRNVDQAATEALAENAGKIVKGYDTNLDPSGIDAEASIKNGAHIIYKDTNNSANDFHQREVASIK